MRILRLLAVVAIGLGACGGAADDAADGTCSNPTFMDGTTCVADENPGRCVADVCTGLCEFVDCNDGNDCTEDLCDPAHGSCFNPPVSDGAICDAGGDPGQCSTGLCVGLCADADCDDGKECTENLCDRADGSCNYPNRPEGSDCDFGGLPGRCESGACVDAELCREVDCSDGNACTEDVCDPANASCSNPNKVDGSFCETGGNPGLCVAGGCRGLCEGVSCDDGNQCTVDMCDPSNASCPNPDKSDGTPCSYGNDPGRCSSGLCVGLCTGVVCDGDDHNQCTSDTCDSATGSCAHADRAEGVWCDFGGVDGVCDTGSCRERSWGAAVLIETDNAGSAGSPQVSMDANGNAVAVWHQDDGIRYNIWSNRYSPASGWGNAELIETDNAGSASSPEVAMDPGGNAVAVWRQHDGSPENRYNIWSKRYSPASGWGNAELIETDNAGTANSPQVSMDANGNAVAVWYQNDGTRYNIWSNRYSPASGWGSAELIETNNANSAISPRIAMDTNGNATAVWQQGVQPSSSTWWNIWSNRYSPASGWGNAELIEADNAGSAGSPQVSMDANGNAVAVWHQDDGTRYNIWSNRYSPASGWGNAELIETDNADGAIGPQVAMDPNGNAVAVWSQGDGVGSSIRSNRYSPASGWGSAELVAYPSQSLQGPQVAMNPSGSAAVVWSQYDDYPDHPPNIWSNHYTPVGGWGSPELIETDPSSYANGPQVSIDANGNAVAVWTQDDGTRNNIWANRFE